MVPSVVAVPVAAAMRIAAAAADYMIPIGVHPYNSQTVPSIRGPLASPPVPYCNLERKLV